jgi:hypothetical protein
MAFYGVCCGGPYDGRRIHHHESPYRVGIAYRKAFPGQMAPTVERPIKFGHYVFDQAGETWVWDGPETRDSD